jgi:hypothetical protein
MLVQLLVPGFDCDLKLNSVTVRGVPMAATGPCILYLQSLSKMECGSVDLPVRYLDTSQPGMFQPFFSCFIEYLLSYFDT